MRNLPYRLTLVAAMSLVSFGTTFAETGATTTATATPKATERPEASEMPEASKSPRPSVSPESGKPADAGMNSCKKREAAVNGIMARIVERGNKQIVVFDTIATRTETFYTAKGATVANYTTLVAAVNTAKAKAKTDLAAMKTTGTINCAAADPKATVKAFKTSLQTETADLKAYKTAVKNLIVAVKSVQSTESPKPSESPKASVSPRPSVSPAANKGGDQ